MEERNKTRLQIITLYKHTAKTMTEIANELNVSKSTVSRTIQRYEETGSYETNYQNCGRAPQFDDRDIRHMRNLCVKSPRATATQLAVQLGASGDCDISTVRRYLRKIG